MSIAEPPSIAAPTVRRWTRDEYHQMGELGMFQDQHVQLLDGEIVAMSPQKFQHYSSIDRVVNVVTPLFGDDCWVRSQAPLTLSEFSEPEPDVSVVAGSRDDYSDHPETALLVVEVSKSSLAFDRNRKAALYARAGIPEYWIVNLVDRQLEVHRSPQGDGEAASYSSVSIHREIETVALLSRPDVTMRVLDLLP